MQRPDLDAPDSEWLVYADALQVSGDPRGELITLVHAADAAARDAHVDKHAEALLGPATAAYRRGAYRVTWRHCFIDTAEVRVTSDRDGVQLVRALLEAPAVEQLGALAIAGVTDDQKAVDLAPAIAAAAETPWPARCRALAIVDERATRARTQVSREFGADENIVAVGSLAAVWKIPNLEHVRLELADTHPLELAQIDGRNLRTFILRTLRYGDGWEGAPSPLSENLAATDWPRLEELELRLAETFLANIPYERDPYLPIYSEPDEDEEDSRYDEADDGDNDGVDYSQLEPLLAKLHGSPIRRLALTSFDSGSSLLEALRRTGLPPTLKVLDLSDSTLHREHVRWMRENAKLFAPLSQLVLERTHIEDGDASGLQGLGPAIVHSYASERPTYRYVVGQE